MVIGGERRWRAVTMLGWQWIHAKVVNPGMEEDDVRIAQLVENIQREAMKPIEEARAYQMALDRGISVEDLAKALGVSQPRRILDRTALLNLDETIQTLVDSGQFPLGHANYLVDLPKQDQVAIVRLFSSGKLKDWAGVRAAAQAVRDRIAQRGMFDHEKRPEPSKDDVAAVSRMERTVERIVSAMASGFKDGELVAIKTVDPNKASTLADTLAAVARTARSMEAQLREAHARTMLLN